MTYAPATYSAPPRLRLAERLPRHARPRRSLWHRWAVPYSTAQVRRCGFVLLVLAVAVLAFVAGIVWAYATGQDTVPLQQAVVVLL